MLNGCADIRKKQTY